MNTLCPTIKSIVAAALMVFGLLSPNLSHAQQAGNATAKNGALIDFREELRQFVINIGKFARKGNPDFKIIAEDALGLVVKADPEDDTRLFPAKTFIVNIDGVLQREVSTLVSKKQVSEESIQIKDEAISIAAKAGLNVLALDFAQDKEGAASAYSANAQRGIVPFVAESQNLSSIPAHPSPVFNTNSESVVALKDVKNFLYLENTQGFGSTNDYINRLRNTDYDAIIIGVYHGRNPLSANDVRLLKYKKTGGRRLVFAAMDITTAASSLYYWRQGWKQGTPQFMDMSLRNDPDRHRTHYWDAGWQSIIYGGANSYTAGIVTLGFDGVVMQGLNGWRYYETGETEEEQDAIQ